MLCTHTHTHSLCPTHQVSHFFFLFTLGCTHTNTYSRYSHEQKLPGFVKNNNKKKLQKNQQQQKTWQICFVGIVSPSGWPYGQHSCSLVTCSLYLHISTECIIPSLLELLLMVLISSNGRWSVPTAATFSLFSCSSSMLPTSNRKSLHLPLGFNYQIAIFVLVV